MTRNNRRGQCFFTIQSVFGRENTEKEMAFIQYMMCNRPTNEIYQTLGCVCL